MKIIRDHQKPAFSIIELLVVISIMLIFMVSVLAQYNKFTEETKLKNDAKKLVDVIELAKKKALTSDLIVTPFVTPPTYCANFTGYQLTLNSGNYTLNYCCSSDCSTVTSTYNLKTSNSITMGTGNLGFPPLMTGANITINIVRLKNSIINKCIDISISTIGIVGLDETLIEC